MGGATTVPAGLVYSSACQVPRVGGRDQDALARCGHTVDLRTYGARDGGPVGKLSPNDVPALAVRLPKTKEKDWLGPISILSVVIRQPSSP